MEYDRSQSYPPMIGVYEQDYADPAGGKVHKTKAGKTKKIHHRQSKPLKSEMSTITPASISPDSASSHSFDSEDKASSEDGSDDEPDDKTSNDILYLVRCFEPNKLDKTFYARKQFKGLELTPETQSYSAIEVMTNISGRDSSGHLIGQTRSSLATTRLGPKLALGKNFVVSEIRDTTIVINSRPIQEAIKSVVTYYPQQNLTGKSILIYSPYSILFHHYDELKHYRNSLLPEDHESGASCSTATQVVGVLETRACFPLPTPQSDEGAVPMQKSSVSKQAAVHDIDVLLRFLEPDYRLNVLPEEQLHERGVASFTGIWLLLKPGIDVYAKIDGQLSAFVVVSAEKKSETSISHMHSSRPVINERWVVTLWNLEYAGRKVARQVHRFVIAQFSGEREIISLPVFPSIYHDKIFKNEVRSHLEGRGKKYWDCLRRIPTHMRYDGSTLDRKPKQYSGEIVVDPRGYLRYLHQSFGGPPPGLGQPRSDDPQFETEHHAFDDYAENWNRQESAKDPPDFGGGSQWILYNNIDPMEDEQQELTKHHYFLFPQYLLGFALKAKTWMIFNIDYAVEIEWPRDEDAAMKHLVLPPHDKETVKALSRKFIKVDDVIWSADYIEDKGAGQVFLLHGPPGTGKTFTVECVAKYAQRPLLSLTVADIGIEEDKMETMLSKWFQLAANWRAVLLLDEADVFLEQRQVTDLQRNSLVSVFLRTMEYYTGMLFLTTNRMGQIDDAFLSRIQVALGYKKLDMAARNSIWTGFFDKIEDERPDIIISERAKRYVREDKEFSTDGENWNGREIRNALHTAIALANHDANSKKRSDSAKEIRVEVKHFEKVSLRRAEFMKYRNRIGNNLDEEGRAVAAKNRARAES